MAQQAKTGPAARAYQRGQADREPYLVRGRRVSRLTVTSVCRDGGDNGSTSVVVPWQTFGAYAVNTMAAKYVMGVYPPGTPYIKLAAEKSVLDDLDANVGPAERGALKSQIEVGLSKVEVEFTDCCEEDGDRMVSFDTARHLIIVGNHCEQTLKSGRIKGIPLEQYVVFRDGQGQVLEAVIEETMAWEALAEDVQAHCIAQGYEVEYEEGGNKQPKPQQAPVTIYTHIRLKDRRYKVCQEVWGVDVKGTDYEYNPEALPFNFLRFVSLKNEAYGRSHCEDYEGDLQSLDGLWQIIIEGSAAVAQLKWLIKAGGITDKKTFTNLPNGGVMTGDPEDVGVAHSEKQQELSVAAQMADKIEQRLSRVFLLYSSVQRAGERVTREEIVTLRQDIDAGLGGAYSNATVEWQMPRARSKMLVLQRLGRVTKLPPKTTKLKVITGDAALGRALVDQATDELIGQAAAVFGPEVTQRWVRPEEYLKRKAAAKHIDPDALIKTADEVAEEDAQAAQTQLALTVAPEAVKQGGEMAQNSQKAALAPEGAPQ